MELFACTDCSKYFESRGRYNQHLNTHRKPYKCETCSTAFGLRSDLNRHVKARHRLGNTRFTCEVPGCISKFARKDNIKLHMKRYHPDQSEPNQEQRNQVALVDPNTDVNTASTIETAPYKPVLVQHWWQMAALGNVAVLATLLEAGCDINMSAGDGNTALHCAARAGQTAAIEFLLREGAQINPRNERSETPLSEAAVGKHPDAILLLIRAGGLVKWFEPNPWGAGSTAPTFVDHIVALGDPDLVQAILEMDTPQLNKDRDAKALAFAVAAAKCGQVPVLQLLSRSDPEAIHPVSIRKFLPIDHSIYHGHLTAVRMLLVASGFRDSPALIARHFPRMLRTAIRKGDASVLQLLLDYDQTAINSRGQRRYSPLHLAVLKGHIEIVEYLLSCPEIDVSARNSMKDTALHMAARSGHTSIIQALLDHNDIDVAVKGRFHETPLLAAFWHNQLDAVRMLSKVDASVLESHETYLEATSLYEVAQRLLQKRILVISHAKERSLLYLAAEFGDIELTEFVLSHKDFDPEMLARTSYWELLREETALQAARRKGHLEVAELIEAHEAKHASSAQTVPSLPSSQPVPVEQQQRNEYLGTEMQNFEKGIGTFGYDLQPDFDADFSMMEGEFDFDFDSFLHDGYYEGTGGGQNWMDTVMAG